MNMDKAKSVLRTFKDCAYHMDKKNIYLAAIEKLYGPEYMITVGLQGRMMFRCMVCNKEMNSEHAVSEHNRSGIHQKNTDKVKSLSPPSSLALAEQYKEDSLKYKLLTSNTKAIGLQFVEEFIEREGGVSYFKCNLCGAHGQMEPMYWHLIGTKHTEKYANIRVEGKTSPVTSKNREEHRQFIIKEEGQRQDDIKTIWGMKHYPYEWIKQGRKELKRHLGRGAGGKDTSRSVHLDEDSIPMEAGASGYKENVGEAALLTEKFPDTSQASVGIQVQSTNVEPLENIMKKLNMLVSAGDLPTNDIKSDEDAITCLEVMQDLALTLYEVTNYKASQTVNAGEREELDHQKMNMAKVIGRVEQRLIPYHRDQLARKSFK